jgi:hypothetical protein
MGTLPSKSGMYFFPMCTTCTIIGTTVFLHNWRSSH